MTVEICSCKGLDSKCKKCHGSGYANSAKPKKIGSKEKTPVGSKKSKATSKNAKDIGDLSKEELELNAKELISNLDLKSKKQMQILNSIPFNTSTFRRDLKDKFEELKKLEEEKQRLRSELLKIDEEIVSKKYSSRLKFKHYLSDKEIDVDSNRQLKVLIREYKKLKNKAGS